MPTFEEKRMTRPWWVHLVLDEDLRALSITLDAYRGRLQREWDRGNLTYIRTVVEQLELAMQLHESWGEDRVGEWLRLVGSGLSLHDAWVAVQGIHFHPDWDE